MSGVSAIPVRVAQRPEANEERKATTGSLSADDGNINGGNKFRFLEGITYSVDWLRDQLMSHEVIEDRLSVDGVR